MKTYKNVLVVIHTPTYGGPHNQVFQMNDSLLKRGWKQVVVLPTEEGDGAERIASAGVQVEMFNLYRLRATLNPLLHLKTLVNFPYAIQKLRKIIRANDIDVVQVCGLIHPHAAFAALLERKPIVWQLLSNSPPMLARQIFMPFIRKVSSVIMTTGLRVAEQHPGAIDESRCLIPFFPPVDTESYFSNSSRRLHGRRLLNVQDDDFVVGTVGNFNKQKAHERLVEAAVIMEDKSIVFRILGSHSVTQRQYYEEEVMSKASDSGLLKSGKVEFHEPGDRVAEFLPGFDLFVLTSSAEGAPTSMLEAMSCSLPVVVTNVGSVSEIVTDGENGYLVERGNTAQLVEGIETLHSFGSAEFEKIKLNNRRKATTLFDVEICASTHVKAYDRALAGLTQ